MLRTGGAGGGRQPEQADYEVERAGAPADDRQQREEDPDDQRVGAGGDPRDQQPDSPGGDVEEVEPAVDLDRAERLLVAVERPEGGVVEEADDAEDDQ